GNQDMPTRRTADLPLHRGEAPAWLFRRMVEMADAIGTIIVREYGPVELLRRLSDPFWFQAFGCVLGFDWHSSGVTTTVLAALKEACRRASNDLGIVVCGGKGTLARKTPEEIRRICEKTGDPAESLIYASRMAAKVDSAAVQDNFELYHHCFLFVPGQPIWAVVQQGMDTRKRYARRYHWLSEVMPSFVSDPHAAVVCDKRGEVLNLVAGEAEHHRHALTALSREHPDRVLREVRKLMDKSEKLPLYASDHRNSHSNLQRNGLRLPARHSLSPRDLNPTTLRKVLIQTYERQASEFEHLLGEENIGAATLRSLSLLAELIYHAPASRRDPAAYSFAHGGKDGHPYPVNRRLYDENIQRLRRWIELARIGQEEKLEALRALAEFTQRAGLSS
ncbi:MAG: DUF763 domain-containing protein, partial [Gemmatales bacterium]|nr:DUF763 domain-containing protein [Gemmatales bacterium]MDW8223035.1 DUF763 domain-containing protein [Gemmatales bacterium]